MIKIDLYLNTIWNEGGVVKYCEQNTDLVIKPPETCSMPFHKQVSEETG